MPLTPLTEDARASAREKAVLARAHRQEIKRALSDRELSVRQVLDMVDSDPALAKMPVGQMLRALPGIGAVRAERIIEELHIAPTRRLGGLGRGPRCGRGCCGIHAHAVALGRGP